MEDSIMSAGLCLLLTMQTIHVCFIITEIFGIEDKKGLFRAEDLARLYGRCWKAHVLHGSSYWDTIDTSGAVIEH